MENEKQNTASCQTAIMCCTFLDWVNLHTHFWKSPQMKLWYDKSKFYGEKGFTTMELYELFMAQHSSNEVSPAVWLNVKERLPETPFGKEFNYSDFKAVKCKEEFYPTIARFEKGEYWQQWYCPLIDDIVEVEFWTDLPKSGNIR